MSGSLWPPWTAAHEVSLSFTISQSLLKLRSIDLVIPSNHLIVYCPLLLSSIFPSIRVFYNESALHIRWPKYWNFSLSLPVNIQGWFPLGLTDLICLLSRGLSRVFTPQFESISSLVLSLFHGPILILIHNYWKYHSFDYMELFQQLILISHNKSFSNYALMH